MTKENLLIHRLFKLLFLLIFRTKMIGNTIKCSEIQFCSKNSNLQEEP